MANRSFPGLKPYLDALVDEGGGRAAADKARNLPHFRAIVGLAGNVARQLDRETPDGVEAAKAALESLGVEREGLELAAEAARRVERDMDAMIAEATGGPAPEPSAAPTRPFPKSRKAR